MAGEESYIHPIIQGFLQGAAQAKQAGEFSTSLKQRQVEHQDEVKHQDKQIDLAQKRLDQEHDLNVRKFDLDTQQFKLMQEHAKNEKLKVIAEHIRGGGSEKAFQNQGIQVPNVPGVIGGGGGGEQQTLFKTPEGMVDVMGQNVPVSSFQTQEQSQQAAARGAAGQAGAVTAATQEALAPSKVREFNQKRQLEREKLELEHANKIEELGVTGENQLKLAKIHGGYSQAVAAIHGQYQLKNTALMHQYGLDDGSGQQSQYAENLVSELYNGTTAYKDMPKDKQRLVDNYSAVTGTPLPTSKDFPKRLETVSSLAKLVTQAEALAKKYSIDSPGSLAAGNQRFNIPIVGSVGRTEPGSTMESEFDAFKGFGGKLAAQFDEVKRQADPEIRRQIASMFNPGSTMKDNLAKIEMHKVQLKNIVQNTFPGLDPTRVTKAMGDRGLDYLFPDAVPKASAPSGSGKAKVLQFKDGTHVPDTPENRKKYGVE